MAKTFYTSGTGSQQTLTGSQNEKVAVYQTLADAEADLANLEAGQIVATPDTGDELAQPVDVVGSGNMHAVTSNAVFDTYAVISASSTVITGKPISQRSVIKIMFTSAISGSDTTTAMSISYNGTSYPVKVGKNGSLANFTASEISSGTYRYLQAYTTLELAFDGTQFIIIGNPVVLSSADYTIYADGKIAVTTVDTVTSGNMHSVTSNAVASAMSNQFTNIASDAVSLTIDANTGTSGSFTFTVPNGYKVISFNGYITSGPAGAINLYSFGFPYGRTGTFSTTIFFRNYTSVTQTASIHVYLLCARV